MSRPSALPFVQPRSLASFHCAVVEIQKRKPTRSFSWSGRVHRLSKESSICIFGTNDRFTGFMQTGHHVPAAPALTKNTRFVLQELILPCCSGEKCKALQPPSQLSCTTRLVASTHPDPSVSAEERCELKNTSQPRRPICTTIAVTGTTLVTVVV